MTASAQLVELLELDVTGEPEVFAARQRARDVASELGMDGQDQVRVATAVSELCRDLLAAGAGRVRFAVADLGADGRELVVDVVAEGPSRPTPTGLTPASRLVQAEAVDPPPGAAWQVRLRRRLAAGSTRPDLDAVRYRLAGAAASPLDQLRNHNRELLDALEELQSRGEQLERLNAELEDTNRGVMALYTQLSGELEETNRGVVALYAELDDRGRRLREASEAKSRFLRNVSHELRTPVNSVIGLSRLLLDPGSDPLTGEQRRQVELVSGSAHILLSLVNELLDLARAESGRIEPSWAPLDLPLLIADLAGPLRPLLREGVRLTLPTSAELDAVRDDEGRAPTGDVRLLGHVLRNLLTNAIKFTEAGEVRVAVAAAGGTWQVAVSDTGIGIAADDTERIFEEFYQVKGPWQVQGKGTGLGLPYALRLVELLGGDLDVVSEVGVGSTFTVTLPLDPQRQGPEPESSLPEPQHEPHYEPQHAPQAARPGAAADPGAR